LILLGVFANPLESLKKGKIFRMTQHLRTYETIVVTKVDMPEEAFSALVEKVKSAVTKEGKGEMVLTDDWGKTKIAYPIQKEGRGKWSYFRFKSMPEGVDEVQRNLKISEFVLRQFTARAEEDGADYNNLRVNMPKELAERGERPAWKDDRGPRRPFRGGGGYDRGGDRGGGGGGYDRGGDRGGDRNYGDRNAAPAAAAPAASTGEEN
jgi:small subunit ribosomal protein S6